MASVGAPRVLGIEEQTEEEEGKMTSQRKPTIWVDTLHQVDIASGAKLEISLSAEQGVTSQRFDRATLIRLILCHDYSYTVHDAGEGSQTIDIGVGVVSQEALAAGVLPDPETAGDHPQRGWVYRCKHKLHGFAADQPGIDVRTVYRDLRAQRRMDNGALLLSIRNFPINGAASSINVTGITRCLFRLG